MNSSVLLILASGLCFALSGYLVGWLVGFRRGKALERLELPRRGALHFREGYLTSIHAESAVEALAVLIDPVRRPTSSVSV